ncbi:DNA translocase FtsK 4TM domain-containing protein [Delftia sp. SD018]|jgi:S-DNA-T family DNA segregation ATPase FtsK/SpoIIIE|uniref:DNA translocase FtsK n=1 Tax=Delftia TaxID=80865 RepID=UPI000C26FBA1|nr:MULTISPECIES: DNA translocase FtsK [Delftia]MBD9579915.1 DNA translocase FtsK 4TM domain-containing protein [Delftia sp. DLF01]MBO0986586.1 DNA translocase FtsK 4TM domain-containing protein [Delftia sp. SD083]MBO1032994.1 DNA translocase FtsK 4TM domain-containing protein [Delftia sp. SD018]PJO36851.1 cell division protein FtsK [Delftia acidovorans]WAT86955.1 DNA translocase FtsK 4TM domain-containing protein [Delftia acidovorans]
MTYSLNALNASTSAKGKSRSAARPGMVARFGHEMLLLAGLLALVFWLASMLSYSPQDPAWSTSGAGHARLVANWMGRVGAWLADACYFGFGMSVWWLVLASLQTWLSSFARWLRGGVPRDGVPLPPLWRRRLRFWGGLLLLLGASCALEWTRLYRFESVLPGPAGGVFGYMLGYHSLQWLGFMGSGLIGICVAVIGLAMVFRFSWGHLAESMGARLDGWVLFLFARREKARDEAAGRRAAREREEVVQEERTESAVQHPQPVQIIEPVLQEAALPSVRVVKERQKPLFSELPDSKLPQVDLLDAAQQRQESVSPETLEMTSRLIEKRLKDFGVDVHVVAAMPGPVITRYEIEPATGVKGSQIVNLAKDLARSLSLVSIRVIETIPGKNFMALELPNAKRQSIRLSEVLGSQVYHDAKSMLTMGLGKDIVGNPVVADLAKMPHVLVAGTTGSGKSVGINAMILSLLYKAEARDVRLLMIDPKMLEMSVYEGIPHLLCPVVTDMKQAANGLNWCVAEMERRYKLMSKLGVRNLAGYNTKIDEAKAREESIPNPFSLTPEEPEPLQRLPHIVIVIDELADLMMVVGKKIEELIARLAQKARAAGIHLILATQRPSVDVITGLIKANIPTRIAFQVSSKIDSRTVLDQMGAESLLGMGDMLYMASGTGLPVRVHGAFVSDEEVHRVVGYLKEQGEADYIEGVLEGGTAEGDSEFGSESGDGGNGEKDPMYDQAVEVVLKDRKASISYVQRKLRIGYNRSARLLEDMEKAGLVSGLTASGQREVLVPARAGE